MNLGRIVELFSFLKYKNKLIPWLLYKPHPVAPHYDNSQGSMQMNVWHFIFKVVLETWTELVRSTTKWALTKMLKHSGGQGKTEKKNYIYIYMESFVKITFPKELLTNSC